MALTKLEYIRLDGYKPEPNLRGKTRIENFENFTWDISQLPNRSFDGSSTKQAVWHHSDCVLKPVRAYSDPFRQDARLILCEVNNSDGTPHPSNVRQHIEDHEDGDYRFAFEQEYVLAKNDKPLWFPEDGYPAPQGQYYCSVGNGNAFGREIVEAHMQACEYAGLWFRGINGEVLCGQREFQIFCKGAKKTADDLWMARYLMLRICEEYEVDFILHPKPVKGDRNGSGMHTNFSNRKMREEGGEEYMKAICETFKRYHHEHMAVYGSDNDQRLTWLHETQSIDQFSYAVSDRGASIRIPLETIQHGWKWRLEDRRTAANADPYKVIDVILQTMKRV